MFKFDSVPNSAQAVGYPVPLDPRSHPREAIESLESKLEEIVSSRNKKAACWEKLWEKLTR